MAQKYFPFQRLDTYKYVQATEILSIKSKLQVYLDKDEKIEIQEPLQINPYTFYLELWVVPDSTSNRTADYLWEGEKLMEINHRQLYDPAVTVQVAAQVAAVRNVINSLLNTYRSTYFYVTTAVTRTTSLSGSSVTNTISGSGAIEI